MKKITILLGLLLIACYSYAQSVPEDKLGIWYGLDGHYKISEKSSLESFTYLWFYELTDNFNFVFLNLGYNYHFNPKLTTTIFLGYSDFDNDINMSAPHTYETRLSEQIQFKHKLSIILLDHRFRLEHRFFRKTGIKTNVARIRYRIGTKFKLNDIFFLRMHNELLLTPKLNNTSENRFFSGIGINVFKSSTIQVGYMNRNTPNKQNLHRIQLIYLFKADLRKKAN